VSSEIEKKVKAIYCDVWIVYEEYRVSHSMAQFNERVAELKEKYDNDKFLINILWSFVPVVNTLHARHLIKQEGKIKEEC